MRGILYSSTNDCEKLGTFCNWTMNAVSCYKMVEIDLWCQLCIKILCCRKIAPLSLANM